MVTATKQPPFGGSRAAEAGDIAVTETSSSSFLGDIEAVESDGRRRAQERIEHAENDKPIHAEFEDGAAPGTRSNDTIQNQNTDTSRGQVDTSTLSPSTSRRQMRHGNGQERSTNLSVVTTNRPRENQDVPSRDNSLEVSPLSDGRSTEEYMNGDQERKSTAINVEGVAGNGIDLNAFDYEPIPSSTAESEGHCKLDFKPFAIQTWFLLLTLCFFGICIGVIAAMILLGHKNMDGYHIKASRNHLAFRYVPAAIGTLTTIWWRTIVTALGRMTPYISMAAPVERRNESHRVHRTLRNEYAGNLISVNVISVAQNRHWLLFLCIYTQSLMMLVIVPLKASFIQIVADDNGWTVIILSTVGYVLMTIYGTLILVTLLVLIRLWNRETGVKWDPVSLADQLALVQGSNILSLFQGLEFASSKQCTQVLKKRSPLFGSLRLGYWRNRQTRTIWHGLACIPPLPGSTEFSAAAEAQSKLSQIMRSDIQNDLTEVPLDFAQHHVQNPEGYRYRSLMYLLYDTTLAIYAAGLVTVVALTITGLAEHRVQRGFDYAYATYSAVSNFLAAATDFTIEQVDNFEESFKYRFLPVLLMSLFSGLWINADHFYRTIQPFDGMRDPAPATSNILLDYPSAPPVLVTIKAISNNHWRIALFSMLSLGSTIPPIIATGVFISTPTPTGFTVSVEAVNFWASFVFLILYIFFLVMVRPTPGYRLPRYVQSISDVLCYCYSSRILDDVGPDGKPIFSAQDARDDRIHLESRIHLAKKEYEFGLYLGKDGKRHMGFDVAIREDALGRPVHVTKIDPGWRFYGGFFNIYWRRPRVLQTEV